MGGLKLTQLATAQNEPPPAAEGPYCRKMSNSKEVTARRSAHLEYGLQNGVTRVGLN